MKSVCVIGAGIIGICCALELRRKNFEVILLERAEPASQASFGNAGVISTNGIAPYASPDIIPLLPSYGLNRDPRFQFHWPHFFALLPWLLEFVRHCNWDDYNRSLTALSYLTGDSVSRHRLLLAECDSSELFRDRGWLRLYATQALFDATTRERSNFDNHGVPYEILDHGAITDLEPHISGHYEKAILLTGAPSVKNPQSVCHAYLDLFRRLGGTFRCAEASRLNRQGRAWTVGTGAESVSADHLVVACGAQSMNLLSPLGIRVPLAIERGYHLAGRPMQGKTLSRSIVDIQKGLSMTPMDIDGEQLIRVTSAVNLVARETTPTYRQILDLVPHMESMFPLQVRGSDKPWMGHRPSMPDSVPVIGPAPGHENLWLAFGHGHIGLTTGPKTGVLIANAITGEINDPRADAFLPTRFS